MFPYDMPRTVLSTLYTLTDLILKITHCGKETEHTEVKQLVQDDQLIRGRAGLQTSQACFRVAK